MNVIKDLYQGVQEFKSIFGMVNPSSNIINGQPNEIKVALTPSIAPEIHAPTVKIQPPSYAYKDVRTWADVPIDPYTDISQLSDVAVKEIQVSKFVKKIQEEIKYKYNKFVSEENINKAIAYLKHHKEEISFLGIIGALTTMGLIVNIAAYSHAYNNMYNVTSSNDINNQIGGNHLLGGNKYQ